MRELPPHGFFARTIKSPVGKLVLLASERGLAGLYFRDQVHPVLIPTNDPNDSILNLTEAQMHEYFEGNRQDFDIPLDHVGSDFQSLVWEQIRLIGYGKTASYGEIAKLIGRPNAARAVGRASGANPILIVVPCHRIIGSDAAPTGYVGGIQNKLWLLKHEEVRYGTLTDLSTQL